MMRNLSCLFLALIAIGCSSNTPISTPVAPAEPEVEASTRTADGVTFVSLKVPNMH